MIGRVSRTRWSAGCPRQQDEVDFFEDIFDSEPMVTDPPLRRSWRHNPKRPAVVRICSRCGKETTKTFKRGEGLSATTVRSSSGKKCSKPVFERICPACVAGEPVHLVRESRHSFAEGDLGAGTKEDYDGGDGMMSVVLLFPDRSAMAFPIAEAFR